jgi:hypothetical protein
MGQNYTTAIKQDAGWWIGWIEEVPSVNCQESTQEALLINAGWLPIMICRSSRAFML